MAIQTKNQKKIVLIILLLVIGISVYAQISITSNMLEHTTTEPGNIYYGTVKIQNHGNRNETVRLYQKDFLFYADGSNIYDEPGTTSRSNAPWLQLIQEEVVVAPTKTAEIRYIVKIPPQETLIGTYWSMIMVEAITDSLLNPDYKAEEGKLGLQASFRFAIQIVTHIGETGIKSLEFTNPQINTNPSLYKLELDTENTGERYISFIPYVDLYSDRGLYIGRFESRRRGLYPGTSVRIQIPFPDVLPGKYRAQVIADGGDNDLFGVIYALEFK